MSVYMCAGMHACVCVCVSLNVCVCVCFCVPVCVFEGLQITFFNLLVITTQI